jgi:hypothetical protein
MMPRPRRGLISPEEVEQAEKSGTLIHTTARIQHEVFLIVARVKVRLEMTVITFRRVVCR